MDQAAIVKELYSRVGTLPADKAAIVTELARRMGLSGADSLTGGAPVPDAAARALGSAQATNSGAMQETPGFFSGVAQETAGTLGRMASNDAAVLAHPIDALKRLPADVGAILSSQGSVGAEALDAAKRGDIGRAVRHGAAYAVPLLGPQIDDIANEGESNLPHAAGRAVGFGLLNSAPESPLVRAGVGAAVDAVKAAPTKAVAGAVSAAVKTHLDPAEAAAVQYGRENGVRMRASVQTGSKVASNAEKILEHMPFGPDDIAAEGRAAERSTLADAGAREVAALNPNAPEGSTAPKPLDAGEALQAAALEKERGHTSAANDAYDVFRSIEAQPKFTERVQTGTKTVTAADGTVTKEPVFEDLQLPVDRRAVKLALKPVLKAELRTMPLAQEQSSVGIKALRNIVDGPDYESASITDEDLGAVKGILRGKANDKSYGLARFAIDQLSKAVDQSVERAGPDAVAALKRGREETVNKYKARDYQTALGFKNVGMGTPAEPGSAVDLVAKLTADGDRNVALLRQVAEHTPEHLPTIAQAKVQTLLDKATAEAGTAKPGSALTEWNKQGAETRNILYGDRARNLQNFFTLAKKIGENPNPSGTGTLLALGKTGLLIALKPHVGVPLLVGSKAAARMLFNPETSRLMQAALKLPADAKGADLLGSQLAKAATAAGATPAPAAAPAMGSPDTFVTVPGEPGNVYGAKYKVVERSSLKASHSGKTFNANPDYPLQNDRDYTTAGNQGPVIGWSSRSHFDPKQLLNDNPNADNGPLVTDSAGNVLGGNGRAMILERVASDPQHPGIKAFRDLLDQKAHQFGIKPEDYAGMKEPVLVREVADSEFAGRTKQQAISDFNKSGIKEMTPSEKAIKDANRVSPETLEHFAALLEKHRNGPDATVADVLADHGQEVLNRLIKDGVVTDQERNALEGEKGLTDEGKDRIGMLMAGRFFEDSKVLDSIAPAIRGKVTRLAAPLAQVQGRGAWNLTPAMREAVNILHQAQALKQTASDFIAQDGLFGKQKYSPEAQALANAVQKLNPTELVAAARQYAREANDAAQGDSMFGAAPTPAESFDAAFGEKAIDAAIAKRAEKKNALAGDKAKAPAGPKNSLAN